MDQNLLFLINHYWTHQALDKVMAVASSWDFWWPFLLLGGILILLLGGHQARAMLLAVGLSIGITDGIVVRTLKNVVGRPRPHETLVGVRMLDLAKARPRFLALAAPLKEEYSTPSIQPPRGNSFPSGHAANNFAIATVVFIFYRRWGWLAYFPALVVAYSRIYVGSHWPLDVLVSCCLGAAIAMLTVAALESLWRKYGARILPNVAENHPSLLAP